jgi:flavin-dependent dehydrogenase
MKYDLTIIGGGPGGLIAAKTAAEDGLKVLLIEKKRSITEVNRLCGQLANINMISVSGIHKYAYSEPLQLELSTYKKTVHWPAIGFSMEYTGPLKPYLNYVHFSPNGHKLYRIKDRFFGFYWEKEALLADLLSQAEKAGTEIITGTIVRRVDNDSDGVRVEVDTKGKARIIKAKKAIIADGKGSKTVEQLGVLKDHRISASPRGGVGFVVEGLDTTWGINSWLCFTVPSISVVGNLWMFQVSGDRYIVGTSQMAGSSASESTERFMQLPFFKPWFRNCKVVKKLAFSSIGLFHRLLEPIVGNILILGEAAGLNETSNPGAIACGYQAAKAVLREINGDTGFISYSRWWQNAFEGNTPNYGKAAGRFFSLNSLCNDDEVDYLYQAYQGEVGVPAMTIAKDLDRIKNTHPELYKKLERTGMANGLEAMRLEYINILDRKT